MRLRPRQTMNAASGVRNPVYFRTAVPRFRSLVWVWSSDCERGRGLLSRGPKIIELGYVSYTSSELAAGSRQAGELAVTLADQKLYSKTAGGSVVQVVFGNLTTAMVFSIYSVLDYSPYGYADQCSAIFKVPINGTKTGTWSVAGASAQGITYSASSPSIGTTYGSLTTRSFSLLSRTLTAGGPSYTFSAGFYSNSTTGI